MFELGDVHASRILIGVLTYLNAFLLLDLIRDVFRSDAMNAALLIIIITIMIFIMARLYNTSRQVNDGDMANNPATDLIASPPSPNNLAEKLHLRLNTSS